MEEAVLMELTLMSVVTIEPIVKIISMIVFPIRVKMEEAVLMESTLMVVLV